VDGAPSAGRTAVDPCASTDCGEGKCVVTVEKQPLCLCYYNQTACSTMCEAYTGATDFAKVSHTVSLNASFAGVVVSPQPGGTPISVHLTKLDDSFFSRTSSGVVRPHFDLENGRPQLIPDGIYLVEWLWGKNTGPDGYDRAVQWEANFGYLEIRQDKTVSIDFPRLVPVSGVIEFSTDWGWDTYGRLVGQHGTLRLLDQNARAADFSFNSVDGSFKGMLPEGRYDLFFDVFALGLPWEREPLVRDAIEIGSRDTVSNPRIRIPTHRVGLTITEDGKAIDDGRTPSVDLTFPLSSDRFVTNLHRVDATRWEALVPSGNYTVDTGAGLFTIKVPESPELNLPLRTIPAEIQVLVDGVPSESTPDFSFVVNGLRSPVYQGNGRYTGLAWEGVPTKLSIEMRTGVKGTYPRGTHTFKEGDPPAILSINKVTANFAVDLAPSQSPVPSNAALSVRSMEPGGTAASSGASARLPLSGSVVLPHGMYSIWYRDDNLHLIELGTTVFDAVHTSFTHTVTLPDVAVAMRAVIDGAPAGPVGSDPRRFKYFERHTGHRGGGGEVDPSGNFSFSAYRREYFVWVEGVGTRCFAIEASR
jgi:hypothetical protein